MPRPGAPRISLRSAVKRLLPAWAVRRVQTARQQRERRDRWAAYLQELDTARREGRRIVHLLHIGKTGGTAVKEALQPVRVSPGLRIELHPHSVVLADIPEPDRVIFFLRDPLARFVSGFHSRLRQGKPHYDIPWTPAEAAAFARFPTPVDLALALSAADRETRTAAHQAMRSIRHVASSFWDWFADERSLLRRRQAVLFIGHQETLGHDFVVLRRLLGLPETVSLPQDEKRAHRGPGGLSTTLPEAAIANLREWYARDYAFLAFCQTHLTEAIHGGVHPAVGAAPPGDR